MGMFTRILHPDDMRELQIKTGDDDLETYSVGDKVDWHIRKDYPCQGTLLDGAYDSYSDRGEDDWVIIRNHQVLCVVPREENLQAQDLEEKYKITPYDRNWWTEEQHVKSELEDAERKLKSLQEEISFLKSCLGKSDSEIKEMQARRLGQLMTAPIREMLNYEGLTRKIFHETVLEE
jgi:hypothetical protein